MVRTPGFDKNGMKKGAWSPEEDDKLRSYIQRYGHWNWRELPKYAGLSRCGKSCRLRWLNYLCPNVKRGNFSDEEVNIILELHEKLGNKWSAIAAKLPGRTDNEIKNYWHTHLSKRQKREQATSQAPKDEAVKASQPQRSPIDQCIAVSQFEANCRNSTQLSPENVGVVVAPPAHPILESSRTSQSLVALKFYATQTQKTTRPARRNHWQNQWGISGLNRFWRIQRATRIRTYDLCLLTVHSTMMTLI